MQRTGKRKEDRHDRSHLAQLDHLATLTPTKRCSGRRFFRASSARKSRACAASSCFRRPLGAEVEFITIMWFSSLAAVKDFAGDRYEQAVVPPAARALLARFDECSQHYEIREVRDAV